MKFAEIINRITGFSIPIFGLSWQPIESEIQIARRVITFLEDRRVLFRPTELEIPHHCVHSIMEIRSYFTNVLSNCSTDSEIARSTRAMRASCRKFLDKVNADERLVSHGSDRSHFASWVFNSALGELRGLVGLHVAKIAATYGLDVEDDLASILPPVAE